MGPATAYAQVVGKAPAVVGKVRLATSSMWCRTATVGANAGKRGTYHGVRRHAKCPGGVKHTAFTSGQTVGGGHPSRK